MTCPVITILLFWTELPEEEPNCAVRACRAIGPDRVSVPKSETTRVVVMADKASEPLTVTLPRPAKAPCETIIVWFVA